MDFERLILERLFLLLQRNRRWPVWAELDRELYASSHVPDPWLAARSIDRDLLWGLGSGDIEPEDSRTVGLSVSGLATLPAAHEDLRIFVDGVRLAADLCRRNHEDDVIMSPAVLKKYLRLPSAGQADLLTRHRALWETAGQLWQSLSGIAGDPDWSAVVNRKALRRYVDVADAEQYLRLASPASSPGSGLQASSEPGSRAQVDDAWNTVPVTAKGPRRPTAIVSYSHTEAGWAPEQVAERIEQIHRLVYALRTVGAIDADADIFHPNEDWTRWGPAQVAGSDFVLIVASPAWKDAWIGDGGPKTNKGVRAEADAVRSIEQAGRPEFQKRVRLVVLPSSSDTDIPVGMHGIARYSVSGFEQADLEELLRGITDQPKFLKPPLGEVPVFPPAMTTHTPEIANFETGTDVSPLPAPIDATPSPGPTERTGRITQLKAQLDALPVPTLGEGPDLPLLRLRQQIESRLGIELREATDAPADDLRGPLDTVPVVDWMSAANIQIAWADSLRRDLQYGASALVVHIIPIPQSALSQRVLSSLDDTAARIVRDLELVDDGAGLTRSSPDEDILIEADPVQLRGNEVLMSRFLALRTGRSGQVSVWYALPRDHMGSVLDEDRLKRDAKAALGLAAAVLDATYGATVARAAVGAELVNTTSLTGGTLRELGTRNDATLPGAFRSSPRMEPHESVDIHHLLGEGSWAVAEAVAKVLVRSWTS
jgi:hypothetical protein